MRFVAVKVGELYARLTLNDAEFKKKIDEAEKRIGDLAKKSAAAFAAIAGSITAATIAAGRYSDQMQAISGQTGLAVESVQALSHAAMRFNADLGLLQTSMRAFVRRSAEAAQGNMSFLQTYQQLGISQAEVSDGLRDIEGLFLLVADRIARLPTEAQRSAAAMQLLGDAGRQLVPMLSQGASGIREAMEEARQLGIVTRRDAVAGLADFVGEVDVLRAQLAGASRVLAAEFLPTIRAGVALISQATSTVSNLDASTRRLVSTIGIGAAGAIGSMTAFTTATWAAVRAWQALSVTLKLASGPTGWIALAVGGIIALSTGLSLASFHARQARQEVEQFATLGDLDSELERVNRELAEAEEKLNAFRQAWATPVRGGPQMRFEAAPDGEGLLDRIEELTAYRDALEQRRQDIQRLQDQHLEILESFETVAETESEAYRRWQDAVEAINRELELYSEKLYITQELVDAAVDQEQFRRATEHERVALLQREAELQQQIVDATKAALASEGLLADEAAELEYQLALAEATLWRLGQELRTAGEELRLAEYQSPFERLSHLAELFRLQLETGARPAEELAERVADILEQIESLNDGTVTYLATLREWQQLQERIQATMPARVPVTPPTLGRPEVLPGEERIARQFERLRLQVEANLVPVKDAVARLAELRAELIRMATQSGSLASATEEQIQLYIQLTSAMEAWIESLKEAPSRLDEIRAERDRALGVGMAVERELARATGADFDPIAYEMDVLTRAIREMYDATGAITPEMEDLLRDLAALAREHEALATTEGLVRSALDGFGRNLGDLGRLLSRSVTFQAGQGFGLDATSLLGGAIGVGIDLLFSAIGGLDDSSQALERAAEALETASESWRRTLSEGQFHELLTATPAAQIEELRKARADAQHEIAMLERRWIQIWNAASRGARIRELQDVIDEIDRTIKELESSAATDVVARIEELLGITTRGLQGAISGAFSAATAEDFAKSLENSLTGRIRNAWVTAFLESATMAPLFESLGDSIREALLDVDISPDEMEGIRAIIDEIKQRSQPFYELLDEMGLLADVTERVNREFERLVNVPLGRRVLQALRFQSMTPAVVPTFHGGGVMPYDGLANLRRGEIILTPEQAAGMGGDMVFTGSITVVANDPADFERQLRDYQRRQGLRRVGNPTALERVRR